MTNVVQIWDIHDSAKDSTQHFIPMSDVPKKVKKMLKTIEGRARHNIIDARHNIIIDEDDETLTDMSGKVSEDEETQEVYVEEFKEWLDAVIVDGTVNTTLAMNGIKIEYVIKKWAE